MYIYSSSQGSFATRIDLDKLVIDVANMLDVEELGEDNWIEVFPTQGVSPTAMGEYYVPAEITGPGDKTLRASFKSNKDKVIVSFKQSGNQKECSDIKQVAAFIAEQFGIDLDNKED